MGAAGLSDRGIIGRFFATLEATTQASWITPTSMLFQSTQFQEIVRWLGSTPAFRKWEGERSAAGIEENSVTILNEDYEATLEFRRREVTQDKTTQVMTRVDEFAIRAAHHWASLMTDTLILGDSTDGYDGEFFFDDDHPDPAGGSADQDNDRTANISTPQAPSDAEVQTAIRTCIKAILGFLDDRVEPMNEQAKQFLIVCPVGLVDYLAAGLNNPVILSGGAAVTNLVATFGDWTINLVANARLDRNASWWAAGSTRFAMFRVDGSVKPLIRIQDTPPSSPGVRMRALGAGSEHEAKTNKHLYGADVTRGVGFGYWQMACLWTWT